MALGFQLAFGLGLALVALSFAAIALGRARTRYLVAVATVLGTGALVSAGALAFNLVASFTDTDALLLAAGGLAAAALAELGLVALARGLRRVQAVERLA